jgi:histidinol dehydrogenase
MPPPEASQEANVSRIHRLDSRDSAFTGALDDLLAWESVANSDVQATVQQIVDDVRQRGDVALLEYTARFDRLDAAAATELEVPQARLDAALATIDPQLRADLELAAERLRGATPRPTARCSASR